MPTTIITPDQDSIVTQIEVAAPPERVFQALTDAKQLKCWFGNPECPAKVWEMDAGPGGHYRYVTEKGAVVVNHVSEFECHGEIVEYDPPRVLAYTWIANWHDDLTRRTIVRWELTPKVHWNASKSHAQRSHTIADCAQGLHRRLARRARNAEEIRRRQELVESEYGRAEIDRGVRRAKGKRV
jgi:uncharacterized protein YndB with AHSA1/START domain